jgi:hypothetical protein
MDDEQRRIMGRVVAEERAAKRAAAAAAKPQVESRGTKVESQNESTAGVSQSDVARSAEAEAAPAGGRATLPRRQSEAEQQLRPTVEVTESHLQQAREAVAQLRGENVERAPDILDDLDGVTRGPLRVPAELEDVIDASRERLAEALHNKPWRRLSSAQRKKINGSLRVSTTEGFAANEALPGLGDKWRGLTVDDLTNTVLDAAEGRLLQNRKEDSAEVKQMAQEMAACRMQKSPTLIRRRPRCRRMPLKPR